MTGLRPRFYFLWNLYCAELVSRQYYFHPDIPISKQQKKVQATKKAPRKVLKSGFNIVAALCTRRNSHRRKQSAYQFVAKENATKAPYSTCWLATYMAA